MAPTHNTNNSETTVASSDARCCRCGGLRSSWDTFLPISRRGAFFQDSFFSNIQQHFDSAVRQVLDGWSDAHVGLRQTDLLDRYRRLRSRDPKEENQAVTVTSDGTSHKVVLDVHEFLGGDMKVKVEGEEELVVEGRVERKEDGRASLHSFRRRFVLPRQTNLEAITSVVSSDGVLTVTVPKKDKDVQQKTTIIPVKLEETKMDKADDSTKEDVPVGCHRCAKVASTRKESSEKESSEMSLQKESHTSETQTKASMSSALKEEPHSFLVNAFLPIGRRGLFFDDSFFQESRKDFQKAVKDVLCRWDEGTSVGDDMARYRRLRSLDLREENQAVASSEDEQQHKFVLDVSDFADGGEVSVKALSDRELVVEGRKETEADGTKSSKRFLRRFVVPGDIQLQKVTSVVSSDGVLTISAPKKPTLEVREVVVPISLEGSQEKTPTASISEAEQCQKAQRSIAKENESTENSFNKCSAALGHHSAENIVKETKCTAPRMTIIPVRIQ